METAIPVHFFGFLAAWADRNRTCHLALRERNFSGELDRVRK